MFRFFYGIAIRAFGTALKVASLFNPKAKKWVDGRRNWQSRYAEQSKTSGYIWVHCASLGEFEQGRPVIEALKENDPDCKILLSFFSPSGYEIRKDYALADVVCYLPLDKIGTARAFLKTFKPRLALFVKYEIWPNYFLEMQKMGVPIILFSAIFRPDQRFFKPWGALFRRALKVVDHVFVQDEASAQLLNGIGIQNFSVSGDTRFDRVVRIAEQAQRIAIVEEFIGSGKTIVVGSSWPAEERVVRSLLSVLGDEEKVILAPHEIDSSHLSAIESLLGDEAIFYSKAQMGKLENKRVLVIDNMGMLSRIYRYADLSIVGGGFGKGIHNTLEAAVFGMPVLFGPEYRKFREACELIEVGAAQSANSESELKEKVIEILKNEELLKQMGEKSRTYVHSHSGATKSILDHLKKKDLIGESRKSEFSA